jgi:hypothetical protein
MSKPFDLAEAFRNKQAELLIRHAGIRAATTHPDTTGDQSEADWRALFRDFLPSRYEVGPIFAVDSNGAESQQIDLAIFDQQYSPQWFGSRETSRFVPVESVYAVFEIKPSLTKEYVEYAKSKVASVRNLKRTSAPIIHAGGRYIALNPDERPVIGGILAAKSGWSAETTSDRLREHLPALGLPESLDIGIALDTVAFDFTPDMSDGSPDLEAVSPRLTFSPAGDQLIYLAIRLFRQLQLVGSAMAIDMSEYEKHLTEP